jgi:hypothetical protein
MPNIIASYNILVVRKTKLFCDSCGKEFTDSINQIKTFLFVVPTVGDDGIPIPRKYNDVVVDLCGPCQLDAITHIRVNRERMDSIRTDANAGSGPGLIRTSTPVTTQPSGTMHIPIVNPTPSGIREKEKELHGAAGLAKLQSIQSHQKRKRGRPKKS